MKIVEINNILHRTICEHAGDVTEVLHVMTTSHPDFRTIEKAVDENELLHVAPRAISLALLVDSQWTLAVIRTGQFYISFPPDYDFVEGPGNASASHLSLICCYA